MHSTLITTENGLLVPIISKKTFPFKETILQFGFFCKIGQNNQQDFLKKLVVGGGVINHQEGGVRRKMQDEWEEKFRPLEERERLVPRFLS